MRQLLSSKSSPAPLWAVLLVFLLQACSSGSGGGASNREIDLTSEVGSAEFIYNGPPPASDEIQNYKVAFYDALAGNDRCGECHTPGKSGRTPFVDQGDVNNAWQLSSTLVNLNDPPQSEVVQRVTAGHNCWLGPDQAATCATTMIGYIERWAAGNVQSTSSVQLSPRTAVDPSGTKIVPDTLAEATALGIDLTANGELLELLNTYCSNCHSDTAQFAQVPYFASEDPDMAFNALSGKIDLVDPAGSRVVLRLDPESHNCWDDCGSNADEMEAAIGRFAALIPETDVDNSLVISRAQVLENDGIVANSGGRFETSLIAKWEFREGTGNTTADTSGILPEIPLTLSGEFSWLGGWGVRFVNGKAQGGVGGSGKLFERITGTGEYSIEAWVAPNNVTQEDAWIVGYAGGPDSRNMLLTQTLYNYEAYNRSTATEDNNAGAPALSTDDGAELAQATLQHVVVTYDPVEGRKIFVNGVYSGDIDESGGGLLNNWSEAFALVLGNTTANSNPWAGTMRMVAIHNAALSADQVLQNFDVGVGQKYYLMFSVSELLDMEGVCHVVDQTTRTNYCYVVFEVSQFDDSAYLFNEPFFVNINPNGGDVDFDLSGIRLGINGKLAEVGQAFVNVSANVNTANFGELGQTLASIGTVIPVENGADQDVFFLAFDDIEGQQGPADDGDVMPYLHTLTGTESSDIAMRTFDEINATLSQLTGVPVANSTVSAVTGKTVQETFNTVRRALPSIADFQAYMSSHQMAATQLAAAYCDALVQDVNLREDIFPAPPTFDFSTPVADPGIDWRNSIVVPLVDRAINSGLLLPAERTEVIDEVELLITDDRDLKPYIYQNGSWVPNTAPEIPRKKDGLIYCVDDAVCPASRTADVVKASCTAVFGSAVVLMQ